MKLSTFYKFPPKSYLGGRSYFWKKQKKIPVAYSYYYVRVFLKPAFNSVLHIISYNFPKYEWENDEWLRWLRE
jgi:hypothetical protein